jgi:hypothetical protein
MRTAEALELIGREGQGVLRISVVEPRNIPAIAAAALGGDARAARFLLALDHTIERAKGRLCLLCDFEFAAGSRPAAVVFITAGLDDPERYVASALCADCAGRADVEGRIAGKIREDLLPDLREIQIHPGAGSA